MDAKITKQRLSRMLSYDWLKIIGMIVGICLVWSLVFTMTATQITPTQKFYTYSYVDTNFTADFAKVYKKEVFSYEVIEAKTEALSSEVNTILEARFAVGEGDLIFLANAKNADDKYKATDENGNVLKDENGDEIYLYNNYTQTFANGRVRYLYTLDGDGGYFANMEVYLTKYFGMEWKTGELNEAKVKADFRARVKKDKRYKTEEQLLQGEKDDIARLNSYREALIAFYGYFDAGVVAFETVEVTDYNGEKKEYTCYLNLNPTTEVVGEDGSVTYTEKNAGLEKYVNYYEKYTDANGKEANRLTSKNMCVGFLDFSSLDKQYRVVEGFQYEALLFINQLIEASLTSK